jgi:hypothetical protein
MATIRLKYVDRFIDRHGQVRYYFRRCKGPRIPLPGAPGSDDFMEAYRKAFGGAPKPKPAGAEGLAQSEPQGTFECPICGLDQPHYHPPTQVNAYHADQIRNDGWVSVAHKLPRKSGWYLCTRVNIDADQYNDHGSRSQQLGWLLWVRDGGSFYDRLHQIPEVLYYDHVEQSWQLLNLLGNAVPSGAESRFPVYARPKYWQPLPAPPQQETKP